MKNSILLIIISLLICSCKKDETLVFSTKKIEKTSENATDFSVARVSLNFPFANSESSTSDSINNAIKDFIEEVIYLDETPKSFDTHEDIADSFLGSYQEIIKDYPKEVGWEARITGQVGLQTENILNINLEYYIFTGGAHGYFGVKSLLFDVKTGKRLEHKDLFLDLEKFRDFVEQKFRITHKINKDESINSNGFMFENDIFHLPHTIFFNDKGITLTYNNYEIASYADGPQELILKYEEVNPFLKIKIK